MSEPDLVNVLRDMARDNAGNERLAWLFTEAATEIERLRIACAGGLTVAERATNESARLHEQSNRLARSSLKLRQRLDATRARVTRVGEIATDALALAREINRDLLASRIGLGE